MADSVNINTRAGVGSSVNSSVSSSGAVSSSVSSGINTTQTVSTQSTFQTTTAGASGPQGEPGQDGVFSEIASQAEAEAGSDNTKGMSPLRVKQAIDALGSSGAVDSVNGATGVVVLDADDIDDTSTTHKFASASQLSNADSALQPGDNISTLTNNSNYITSAGAPVQSVNSATGAVTLDADDIDDSSTSHKFVTSADLTNLSNLSGTNTGDQDLSGLTTGAASSTDNGIPRFNGTTGKIVQATGYTIDDDDTMLTDGLINSTTIVAAPYMAADTIEEYGTDNGVTIEGVLHQDGLIDGRDVASDGGKLDTIESNADVTDTANVTSAGALMDSEVTNLAAVKAFDPTDYAASSHTHTHANITDYDSELAGTTNTTAFTPSADYHPATKKYVDDEITGAGGYNDEAAQDAIGGILTDSSEIDFTYDDATPSITASIVAGSIDESKLDTSVNASLDLADSAVQPGDLAYRTDEEISDVVGAMVSGNTETNITVTYQDADNTLDFAVANASTSTRGAVELATTAETTTGTDTARAVTPDGLHDMTSLAGAAWFLDEDNMATNSDTQVASQQSIKAYIDTAISTAKQALLPVGSIVVLGVSTNPNTLYGFGTWAQIEGKFIVGKSNSDGDFDLDDTGGAKTHTLTEAEIPSHRHQLNTLSYGTTATHTGKINTMGTTDWAGPRYTDYTGGGGAHNNLPPYIAKYIWQRTA